MRRSFKYSKPISSWLVYYLMGYFKINLVGKELIVMPNEDGTFTIFEVDGELGDLWPQETDNGAVWHSDCFPDFLATQIGELIAERNLRISASNKPGISSGMID
jgi:hypothetical protein